MQTTLAGRSQVQLVAVATVRTAAHGLVLRLLLDLLVEGHRKEPVADHFLDDTVAISQRVYLTRLLTANRCENTFLRLLFVALVLGARRVLQA